MGFGTIFKDNLLLFRTMNSLALILLMVTISYGREEKLDDILHTKRNKDDPKQADQRRIRGEFV